MAGTKIRSKNDQRQYPTKKIKLDPDPITFDHSIQLDETSKSSGVEYFNRKSRKNEWYTQLEIEQLGNSLIEWALNDPEADKLSTYYKRHLICEDTIRLIRKKNPVFDEDCKLARDLIGCRLWSNSLRSNSGWRETTCLKLLPIYDEEYMEELRRIATERLQQQNAEQNKTVKVMIERYTEDKE